MMRFLAVPAAFLALLGPATAEDRRYASLPEPGAVAADPRPAPPARAEAAEGGVATTSALRAPAKPWCPPDRLVGTGQGFCLVN